ncbi:MAG: lamin tail domain-containing protein [Verrucomicrobiota bacterium]
MNRFIPSAAAMAFLIPAHALPAGAQVVISELHAAPSERLLRQDEKGRTVAGTGPVWYDAEFPAAAWASGKAPLGFGFTGLATDLAVGMNGITPSLYARKTFTLSAGAASSATLKLSVQYNDGFAAYLNGREIARARLGPKGYFAGADHTAFTEATSASVAQTFTLTGLDGLLKEGENLLAFQVHNYSRDAKGNLRFDASLELSPGAAGAETPVIRGDTWAFHATRGEPSGGIFEPNLPPVPNTQGEPGEAAPFPDFPPFADWIELHNTGAAAVSLAGWTLTDDPAKPGQWRFPENTVIAPGERLLVLCDENNALPGLKYLHASFKLSRGGEEVLLFDPAGALRNSLAYPPQDAFHSYGVSESGGHVFFSVPTPGAVNTGPSFALKAVAPVLSPPGGFYSGARTVTLASATPGAEIRYTLDGTEPRADRGALYTAPLTLNPLTAKTGHALRARAFLREAVPSETSSATYLIDQDPRLRTATALLFTGDPGRDFYKPFGIAAIQGGAYPADLWVSTRTDDYNIALMQGRPYERSIFVEWYPGDGRPGFKEAAGLRLASSPYSRPRLQLQRTAESPFAPLPVEKPSWNILFRGDYGAEELKYPVFGEDYPVRTFDNLRARAGKNDIQNPFIKDELIRRTFIRMGHPVSKGVLNTLYINGIYKGFYNTVERYRTSFFQQHHGGGPDWDIIIRDAVEDGDTDSWKSMMAALTKNLAQRAHYDAAMAAIDLDEIIDYFLINTYTAQGDWPNNNWVAARERRLEGRWRLYLWDSEISFAHNTNKPVSFDTIQSDLKSLNGSLPALFRAINASAEARLRFADRIQRHFFNGGALDDRDLTGSSLVREKNALVAAFQPLLQFTHGQAVNQSFWTNWVRASGGRRSHLFGGAGVSGTGIFRRHGLWPSTEPPVLSHHGGALDPGEKLSLAVPPSVPAGSVIYFTLDNTDPRAFGGEVSATAQVHTTALDLSALPAVTVKARVRNASTGEWSALTEADFASPPVPAAAGNLVLSQLLYHPPGSSAEEAAEGFDDADDFEFIELTAIGSRNVDLSALRAAEGITFDFAQSRIGTLSPGQSVLLVKNAEAFRRRYGTDAAARVAGAYSGKLDNAGEFLRFTGADGPDADDLPDTVLAFGYDDAAPWPAAADGSGPALVLRNPAAAPDPGFPASWTTGGFWSGAPAGFAAPLTWNAWQDRYFALASRSSAEGGAARDLPETLPQADADGDGLSNLEEYVFGGVPVLADGNTGLRQPAAVHLTEAAGGGGGARFLTATWRISTQAEEAILSAESGNGGSVWTPAPAVPVPAGAVPAPSGFKFVTFRDTVPAGESPSRFLRLRFSLTTPGG